MLHRNAAKPKILALVEEKVDDVLVELETRG